MYFATLITTIVQACNTGSRIIATLLAIELGANPFLLGLLISTYSVLPLFLSVASGRVSDRFGARYPMLAGVLASLIGTLLPTVAPGLATLFVSAVLIGSGFIFFNVSVQNLAGSLGAPEQRTRNFSTLALGYASGQFVGPLVVGFAIDQFGYVAAYACITALGLMPVVVLAAVRQLDTPARVSAERRSTFDLLRVPALRRVIVLSGLVSTGWDLYLFYVPIHGHAVGLSATAIGAVLGTFALATFIVRLVLPALTRRFGLETVLATALALSALLFIPFPFVELAPPMLALSFTMGLAMGCGQPLTLNLAYNRAPPGRAGEVAGLRLTVNNITHLGLPVVAGAMGAVFGTIAVFWVAAAILATCSSLAIHSIQR